jgi:hypothetical protein
MKFLSQAYQRGIAKRLDYIPPSPDFLFTQDCHIVTTFLLGIPKINIVNPGDCEIFIQNRAFIIALSTKKIHTMYLAVHPESGFESLGYRRWNMGPGMSRSQSKCCYQKKHFKNRPWHSLPLAVKNS